MLSWTGHRHHHWTTLRLDMLRGHMLSIVARLGRDVHCMATALPDDRLSRLQQHTLIHRCCGRCRVMLQTPNTAVAIVSRDELLRVNGLLASKAMLLLRQSSDARLLRLLRGCISRLGRLLRWFAWSLHCCLGLTHSESHRLLIDVWKLDVLLLIIWLGGGLDGLGRRQDWLRSLWNYNDSRGICSVLLWSGSFALLCFLLPRNFYAAPHELLFCLFVNFNNGIKVIDRWLRLVITSVHMHDILWFFLDVVWTFTLWWLFKFSRCWRIYQFLVLWLLLAVR